MKTPREQEAFVLLQRAADRLITGLGRLLKPYDLSPTQYNVLRILRGATEGLACGEIACRMITHDPDITRMVNRLERRGLIARTRGDRDRRVVNVRIAEPGLRLLEQLDAPVRELHRRQLGHLGAERLRELAETLQSVRDE